MASLRATAWKPSISEEGKGQGCEESYVDLAHLHAGFLGDLAHHGFLEAFAGLDEAGDGRIATGRP